MQAVSFINLAGVSKDLSKGKPCIDMEYIRTENGSVVCPVSLTSRIVHDAPRFSWLRKGTALRYKFTKDNLVVFSEINAAVKEINRVCGLKKIGRVNHQSDDGNILKCVKKLINLQNDHEEYIKENFIDNTLFNRLFRASTLKFQENWIREFSKIKKRIAAEKVNALEYLVESGYEQRMAYFVVAENSSKNDIKVTWPVLKVEPELRRLFSRDNHRDASENGKKRLALVLTHLECLEKMPSSMFYQHAESTLKETLQRLINLRELNTAKNFLEVLIRAKCILLKPIKSEFLLDAYNYLKNNIGRFFDEFSGDPIKKMEMEQVLFSYDSLMSAGKDAAAFPSLSSGWEKYSQTKRESQSSDVNIQVQERNLDDGRMISKIIQQITDKARTYIQAGRWEWPLSSETISGFIRKNNDEFKRMLDKQKAYSRINEVLLKTRQMADKREDRHVSHDLATITYLLDGQLDKYLLSLQRKNLVAPDVKNSQQKFFN